MGVCIEMCFVWRVFGFVTPLWGGVCIEIIQRISISICFGIPLWGNACWNLSCVAISTKFCHSPMGECVLKYELSSLYFSVMSLHYEAVCIEIKFRNRPQWCTLFFYGRVCIEMKTKYWWKKKCHSSMEEYVLKLKEQEQALRVSESLFYVGVCIEISELLST